MTSFLADDGAPLQEFLDVFVGSPDERVDIGDWDKAKCASVQKTYTPTREPLVAAIQATPDEATGRLWASWQTAMAEYLDACAAGDTAATKEALDHVKVFDRLVRGRLAELNVEA